MAEAAVEERPAMPTRFYCHMCNVEINIPNTDFTCPLCAGGFVEELPSVAAAANSQSPTVSTSGGARRGDLTPVAPWSTGMRRSASQGNVNRVAGFDSLRDEIATFLMSRGGPNVEISVDSPSVERLSGGNLLAFGGPSGPVAAGGSGGNGSSSSGLGGSGASTGGGGGATISGPAGGRVRGPTFDRLDNVLFDFLQTLSGGDVDGMFGNTQMFFMGNPGDYAWGREGIDTIVTQLLNQMETSGPPPLTKDKIAEIPKVAITAEEAENKLQCSVCWEDFRLAELVRKLPCTHLYHENCIVPWLDLHGTCPICRKSLIDEDDEEGGGGGGMSTGDDHHLFQPLEFSVYNGPGAPCPRHGQATDGAAAQGGTQSGSNRGGRAQPGNASQTSTTTPTSQQQQQSQQQQPPPPHNNVFGFDDGGNVDLD